MNIFDDSKRKKGAMEIVTLSLPLMHDNEKAAIIKVQYPLFLCYNFNIAIALVT